MTLIQTIAAELNLPLQKVDATVKLLSEENTIPFIARYRKEVTGNLDEEQIRNIDDTYQRLKNLEERQQTILSSIEEQGKLTDELKSLILSADSLTRLEDLYQPYRPKRRTRATIAREKGLEPLAEIIARQVITKHSLEKLVSPFINDAVPNMESALAGAQDIVAEMISEHAGVRETTRDKGFQYGKMISEKVSDAKDERKVYEIYYEYQIPIKYVKPHQILAMNRGEEEKILRIKVEVNESDWRLAIRTHFPPDRRSIFFDHLNQASEDAAKRLLLPAIDRDIRRKLTEDAETHAIQIFAQNLRALLTQPPLSGYVVLAIDPGFRTGSKVVVIDPTGKLLATDTIYPHPPQNQKEPAHQKIMGLIQAHQVSLIVIGNGTASRETEAFIAEITKKRAGLNYLITSEAGASVYSASKLARKEFPDLDVSIRGAISIGRRVQDPLAEFVKIDPKSIGVGLYQHDVNQTRLTEALEDVVESVVNTVGVDINTASPALLTHVAGIGPSLAERIVQHREENGSFQARMQFQDVSGMGPKSYEQSAGFLRILHGTEPLDATAIHPESYPVASKIITLLDLPSGANSKERVQQVEHFIQTHDLESVANQVGTGIHTLNDILEEIARPGRDPREDLPKPMLRQDVLSMEDLMPEMQLKGTIRNVVDFGAFVDIGVKTDGLLHRSKIPKSTLLRVGDIVEVIILDIDHDRKRIALKMVESEGK
jgi:uncharacterized protein